MMQRALRRRASSAVPPPWRCSSRARARTPLIGKVVGVGIVDEITDRTWVVVDAVDGRVHYADLGRLRAGRDARARHDRGCSPATACRASRRHAPSSRSSRPSRWSVRRAYEGPTWLDQAIVSKWRPDDGQRGFASQTCARRSCRSRPLAGRAPARRAVNRRRHHSQAGHDAPPAAGRDRTAGARSLTRPQCRVIFRTNPARALPASTSVPVMTPTGKLAVIRRQDTFTLAPWRPALEPLQGRAVMGMIGPNRVTWALDRGRALPGRG